MILICKVLVLGFLITLASRVSVYIMYLYRDSQQTVITTQYIQNLHWPSLWSNILALHLQVSKRFCEENLQLLFSVLFPKSGKGQLGATQVGYGSMDHWRWEIEAYLKMPNWFNIMKRKDDPLIKKKEHSKLDQSLFHKVVCGWWISHSPMVMLHCPRCWVVGSNCRRRTIGGAEW